MRKLLLTILLLFLTALCFLLVCVKTEPLVRTLGADGLYKEVPIVETKIKDEYRAYYQSLKNPEEIIDKELTKEEYDSMSANTPKNLQIEGYKFIKAYGGKPIIATSAPALKDNEFYRVSTSSEQIMLKLPNKEPELKNEADIEKTSFRLINQANAAIAIDATTSPGNIQASSFTFAHTCSGDNRALFVSMVILNSTERITGVTYNADAMTQMAKVLNSDNRWQYTYGMVAPDSGTHNVVISLSGVYWILYNPTISYTGVKQTDFPHFKSSQYLNGSSSPFTVNVTATVAGVSALAWFYQGLGGVITPQSGTALVRVYDGYTDYYRSDPIQISSTGNYGLTWTDDSAVKDAILVVAFEPSDAYVVESSASVPNKDVIIFE